LSLGERVHLAVEGAVLVRSALASFDRAGANALADGRTGERRADGVAGNDPPLTNRGVEITGGIDWVSCTGQGESPELVIEEFKRVVGMVWPTMEWEDRPFGRNGYLKSAVGSLEGVQVHWSPARRDAYLEVKGGALGTLSASEQLTMVMVLRSKGVHFTRVDGCIDDYSKSVRPSDLVAAFERGELVTRSQRKLFHRGLDGSGDTLAIGSRSSERFCRVYDKDVQSDGRVDAVRVEVQLRDGAAADFVRRLSEPDADLAGVVLCEIVSMMDFREVGSDSNVSRRLRCAWWDAFVNGARRVATPSLGLLPLSLERSSKWLKQCAPAVAMVFQGAMDGDLGQLVALLQVGRARMGPRHRMALHLAGVS
jgi:hypothetical protein